MSHHSLASTAVDDDDDDSCFFVDQNPAAATNVRLVRSSAPPHNVWDAAQQWCVAAEALWESPALRDCLDCSGALVGTICETAVRTALFLPVTLPCLVAGQTTQLLTQAVGVLLAPPVLMNSTSSSSNNRRLLENGTETSRKEKEQTAMKQEDDDGGGPLDLVFGVLGLPGHVLGVTGHIAHEIGTVVTQLVAPGLHNETPSKNKTSKNDEEFLHRLRLDFDDDKTSRHGPLLSKPKVAVAPGSRMLLRVDDLDMTGGGTGEKSGRLHYIDLTGKDPSCCGLFAGALNRLVQEGLSLFANHPTVRFSKPMKVKHDISWKSEGSTSKLLKRLAKLSTIERLDVLKNDTLIWSGKSTTKPSNHNQQQVPFFLSRGVIQMSPRDLLDLLWDNSRTSEYNNYCLGRRDVLMLDGNDVLLYGATQGTKVIESETRVPFTGMSIFMSCLMHVRPLADCGDQGYVILSRSLDSGAAGTHHTTISSSSNTPKSANKKSSEIRWGINVLRQVPNHPHLTDLTSLSQVASSMVPKFMTSRIGVMGIEDFYRNVRALGTTSSKQHQPPSKAASHNVSSTTHEPPSSITSLPSDQASTRTTHASTPPTDTSSYGASS